MTAVRRLAAAVVTAGVMAACTSSPSSLRRPTTTERRPPSSGAPLPSALPTGDVAFAADDGTATLALRLIDDHTGRFTVVAMNPTRTYQGEGHLVVRNSEVDLTGTDEAETQPADGSQGTTVQVTFSGTVDLDTHWANVSARLGATTIRIQAEKPDVKAAARTVELVEKALTAGDAHQLAVLSAPELLGPATVSQFETALGSAKMARLARVETAGPGRLSFSAAGVPEYSQSVHVTTAPGARADSILYLVEHQHQWRYLGNDPIKP